MSQKQVANFAYLFWSWQGELVEDALKTALSRTGTKLERPSHQHQWGDLTKQSTGCPYKANSTTSSSQNTELRHCGHAIWQQCNQDSVSTRENTWHRQYRSTVSNQRLRHRHNLPHCDFLEELFPRYLLCSIPLPKCIMHWKPVVCSIISNSFQDKQELYNLQRSGKKIHTK